VTIVVSGFALPRVNTYAGAPSVYGFTLKAGQQPTVAVLLNSSIEQWYAIDFRVKRRRPITKMEWTLVREWLAIAKRAKKKYAADQAENEKLERIFTTTLVGRKARTPTQKPLKPLYGDPSGLRPVKRRESRRTA
jgi:hypothetical protein